MSGPGGLPPAGGLPSAGLPLSLDALRVEAPGGRSGPVPILDIQAFACGPGARIALTGPSGSGKTTLLQCLAGLQTPRAGRIAWGEVEIGRLRGSARDAWRRRHVGFIFQDGGLVPELCLLGNVLLPARFTQWRVPAASEARARDLLARVGLSEIRRRTALLSRGEQQRAAVARALLLNPSVILADEPTASLDRETGTRVGDLLVEVTRESGATLILATHDPVLAARLDRTWTLAPAAGSASPSRPGLAA